MSQRNTFIIERLDLSIDPVTIVNDGLLVGRLRACDVSLNHPAVSRTHVGIKRVDENFYLFNLRPANLVFLNGRPIERIEGLADGDVLEVGPFILTFKRLDEALRIRVALRIGVEAIRTDVSSPSITTQRLPSLADVMDGKKGPRAARVAPLAGTKALDIFWDKRIREAGKMVRPSPLFPHARRAKGKAQFNWTPTTDLRRRWPLSWLAWGAAAVGLLAAGAWFWYPAVFAPHSIMGTTVSAAHSRTQLSIFPAIAQRANGASCSTCHLAGTSMEANCRACHQTQAFVATVTTPHSDAGIGCITCHAEHKGADAPPLEASFRMCAACHNDNNHTLFKGRSVRTPHGGTLGYPVVDGHWKWKGLDESEWSQKQIALVRSATDTDEQWRSKQFHALHLYRVRATVAGLDGNAEGEMSCSSCHKSFNPIDRDTPRQTCARCHMGRSDSLRGRTFLTSDEVDCTSCHVEHIQDKSHWNPSLLSAASPSH
ncbi:MAG TPA: FHA domain-containing protein [Pyrinomonadaceae bacterium]|jgi:pSer/pThr/pTyr-binding forkhead associated (FHA) protein